MNNRVHEFTFSSVCVCVGGGGGGKVFDMNFMG